MTMAEQLQHNRALMDQKAEDAKKQAADKPKEEEKPKVFVEKMKEELMKMTMAEQLKYNRELMDRNAKLKLKIFEVMTSYLFLIRNILYIQMQIYFKLQLIV